VKPNAAPAPLHDTLRRFALATGVLTLGFSLPLYDLVRFALRSQLYSHIVLIPFISGYLIWLNRKTLPSRYVADPGIASLPMIFGVMALAGYWLTVGLGIKLPHEDRLALTTASYVLLLGGLGGWFLGRELLCAIVFPVAFLCFMVPMPVFMTNGIETFLQHGSAEVAYMLYSLAGTPVFRQELVFQLPGITLQVAPECSGIHSTLALFITSLLAGHFFLRSPVKRWVLALAVIPLALLRNGFRVFVIGELCVHISPDMIHSYIHRKGGPIFFALSLVPFAILLIYLRRWDQRKV
jgi:exosortase C (VPDSG-CTERM-specific)